MCVLPGVVLTLLTCIAPVHDAVAAHLRPEPEWTVSVEADKASLFVFFDRRRGDTRYDHVSVACKQGELYLSFSYRHVPSSDYDTGPFTVTNGAGRTTIEGHVGGAPERTSAFKFFEASERSTFNDVVQMLYDGGTVLVSVSETQEPFRFRYSPKPEEILRFHQACARF